jgi:hypothetical protein
VVVFVSADYAAGAWTRLERRTALDRAVRERRDCVPPGSPACQSSSSLIILRGIEPGDAEDYAPVVVGC